MLTFGTLVMRDASAISSNIAVSEEGQAQGGGLTCPDGGVECGTRGGSPPPLADREKMEVSEPAIAPWQGAPAWTCMAARHEMGVRFSFLSIIRAVCIN